MSKHSVPEIARGNAPNLLASKNSLRADSTLSLVAFSVVEMATIGVFAFIVDEARCVLCVRLNYAQGAWTTPGGRVEPGESPTAALIREVQEETGYAIEVGQLIGTYAKLYQDDVVLSFEARITGRSEWSPNTEIAEIRFFPEGGLPNEIGLVARKRIEDGFRGVRGVFREFKNTDPRGAR